MTSISKGRSTICAMQDQEKARLRPAVTLRVLNRAQLSQVGCNRQPVPRKCKYVVILYVNELESDIQVHVYICLPVYVLFIYTQTSVSLHMQMNELSQA